MELLSGILGVLKDLNKWIPALETGFYFARQFLNNILLHMDYKVANVQQVTFICWNLLTDILVLFQNQGYLIYVIYIFEVKQFIKFMLMQDIKWFYTTYY